MNLHFICSDCHRKQTLDVGDVHIVADKENITDPDRILYEEEVRCKFCGSHLVELQPLEYHVLVLRKALLNVDDVSIGKTAGIEEDKFMPFSKIEAYIEKRIAEEPENGELRLRHANILRKFNEYDKAIKEYEESLRLNPTLIASLINLTDIFHHRSIQYREKGAITKAKEYYERTVDLYNSGNADRATLTNWGAVPAWTIQKEEELYPRGRKRKPKKDKKGNC